MTSPCFLWIIVGATFIERLEHARRLQGALAAITARVVGVIANLTLVWAARAGHAFSILAPPCGSTSIPDPASLDRRLPRALFGMVQMGPRAVQMASLQRDTTKFRRVADLICVGLALLDPDWRPIA